MEVLAIGGLPESIRFDPGCLTITCRDLEYLVEQLVLVARSLDTDYATLKQRIEQPARKQSGSDLRRAAVEEFRGPHRAARRPRLVFRSRWGGHSRCAGSIPWPPGLVKITDFILTKLPAPMPHCPRYY